MLIVSSYNPCCTPNEYIIMFSMQMLFCLTASNVLYLKRVFIKCKAIHEKYRSACFSVSLSTMFYLHVFTLLLLIPSNWVFGRLKCSFTVITSHTSLFYECISRNFSSIKNISIYKIRYK